MQRILIINTLYSPNIKGGAEIVCQNQAERLAAIGNHVAVLTTTNQHGMIQDTVNGLTVYRVQIKNIYWHYSSNKPPQYIRAIWHTLDIYNYRMKKYVRQVIQRECPDIVICHNLSGFSISVLDAIKEFHLPIIQILHDQYFICAKSTAFRNGNLCKKQCLRCHLMRLLHSKKSNNVDAVVGVSKFVLEKLTKMGYFQNSIQKVIHNASYIEDLPKTYIWDRKHPLRIGYIGTLSKHKGVEWLIKSFMALKIDATLTLTGKGDSEEYESELRYMAAKDKRITFLGYQLPATHYQQIDLSVVPSLWEDSFPTVAFESCAYHVPVIATNMGGLPEIIENGVNGIICNPNDENSLKDAILQLYNNPELYCRMSGQARDSIKEMLDSDNNIAQYDSLIQLLTQENSLR